LDPLDPSIYTGRTLEQLREDIQLDPLDPSIYTGRTLEQLREDMDASRERTTHPISEAQKENARLYARVVNATPDPNTEPANIDEALGNFHRQYVIRKVSELPRPKIKYPDARVLFWEILKYLHPDGKVMIEEENKWAYASLVKYFICDPTCAIDLRKGIYLWGDVGRGKSFLMRAMKIFIETIRFDFRKFEIDSCRDIAFKISEDKSVGHMREYFSGKYSFDDFGYEDTQVRLWGNDLNVMEEIIVNRYDAYVRHGLITHVTTNLPPFKIKDHYRSGRLDSRIEEMFTLVELKGIDKRKI
jgi:hypothetical protein